MRSLGCLEFRDLPTSVCRIKGGHHHCIADLFFLLKTCRLLVFRVLPHFSICHICGMCTIKLNAKKVTHHVHHLVAVKSGARTQLRFLFSDSPWKVGNNY